MSNASREGAQPQSWRQLESKDRRNAVQGRLVDARRINQPGRPLAFQRQTKTTLALRLPLCARRRPPRLRCARLLTHQCLDCSLAFLARRPVGYANQPNGYQFEVYARLFVNTIRRKKLMVEKTFGENERREGQSRTRNSSAGGENI